jgi:hypothetical protein
LSEAACIFAAELPPLPPFLALILSSTLLSSQYAAVFAKEFQELRAALYV